jgi:hypothetical protein
VLTVATWSKAVRLARCGASAAAQMRTGEAIQGCGGDSRVICIYVAMFRGGVRLTSLPLLSLSQLASAAVHLSATFAL